MDAKGAVREPRCGLALPRAVLPDVQAGRSCGDGEGCGKPPPHPARNYRIASDGELRAPRIWGWLVRGIGRDWPTALTQRPQQLYVTRRKTSPRAAWKGIKQNTPFKSGCELDQHSTA